MQSMPIYYNFAIDYSSEKMIKYFGEELDMVIEVKDVMGYHVQSSEHIDNLIGAGAPIKLIFNKLCGSNWDLLKYLCENYDVDELKEDTKYIDLLICKGKYILVKYLIKKGFKYKKKLMINRIIKLLVGRHVKYYWDHKLSITMVRYICNNLKGTATSHCLPELILNGYFNIVVFLCKHDPKLKVKSYLIASYIDKFDRYMFNISKAGVKNMVLYLKYCKDIGECPLKQIDGIKIETMLSKILQQHGSKCDLYDEVTYLINNSNIEVNNQFIKKCVRYNNCSSVIQYFKSINYAIDEDVIIYALTYCSLDNEIKNLLEYVTVTDTFIISCLKKRPYLDFLKELMKYCKITMTAQISDILLSPFLDDWDNYCLEYVNCQIGKILSICNCLTVDTKKKLLDYFVLNADIWQIVSNIFPDNA